MFGKLPAALHQAAVIVGLRFTVHRQIQAELLLHRHFPAHAVKPGALN